MGRTPCCDKNGLKKGPWTSEEDKKLIEYIQKNGEGRWRTLPKNAGLARCGKSCRLRWTNYLRPDIKRGRFSFEEEEAIIQLHSVLGNKWSAIAAQLPGRTDNEIKNYWNTHIRKRLLRMGLDPVTHRPCLDLLNLTSVLFNPAGYCTTTTEFDVSKLLQNQAISHDPELLKITTNYLLLSQCQNSGFAAQDLQQLQPSYIQNAVQFDNYETQFMQVNDNYNLQFYPNSLQYEGLQSDLQYLNTGLFEPNSTMMNFDAASEFSATTSSLTN